jgi:hypothetical protein
MCSLKRLLKRLFDDLRFIKNYKPGDPVPRDANLRRATWLVEMCWFVGFIATLILTVAVMDTALIVIGFKIGPWVLHTTGGFGVMVVGVCLISSSFFAMMYILNGYSDRSLAGRYNAHIIKRELAKMNDSGSGPSAPTSSSGSDVSRVACHKSHCNDSGGDYGFCALPA